MPESKFEVQKFVAPECEDNVTITYKINGRTVECHDGVITLKKEKHSVKTMFGCLLTLTGNLGRFEIVSFQLFCGSMIKLNYY